MKTTLAQHFPIQIRQWSDKNGVSPDMIGSQSHKKFIFNCEECGAETELCLRDFAGTYPDKRVLCESCSMTSVAERYPYVAQIWDFDRNKVGPEEVTHGTDKKYHYICPKCGYRFSAIPYSVGKSTAASKGCPYCAGKVLSEENSLAHNHPELRDIYSDENEKAFESLSVGNSDYNALWVCPNGHEPYGRTVPDQIHRKGICPKCKNNGTSWIEQTLFAQLGTVFGTVHNRVALKSLGINCHPQLEADILLPDYRVCVEVDGGYWHKDKEQKDREKNARLYDIDYRVVRLRDRRLPVLDHGDIIFDDNRFGKQDIDKVLEKCI